ncbi:MAG: thioredoxin family protein [Candidatus Babeliales bacterium]
MKKLLLMAATLLFVQTVDLVAMEKIKQLVAVKGNRADIKSVKEFENILRTNDSVVLLVSTTWCGPCKKVKPIIEELTRDLPNVMFVHIDGDNQDLSSLVEKYASQGFPTIKFFKKAQEVQEVIGAETKEKLRSIIQQKLAGGTQAVVTKKPITAAQPKQQVIAKPHPVIVKPAAVAVKPKAPTLPASYGKAPMYTYSEDESSSGYSSEGESSSGYSSSEE